jgi:hypothetical protein
MRWNDGAPPTTWGSWLGGGIEDEGMDTGADSCSDFTRFRPMKRLKVDDFVQYLSQKRAQTAWNFGLA